MANILLVEDDLTLRTQLTTFLESEKHEVLAGANCKEAWELIEASSEIEVILLDVRLPDQLGTDFLKQFNVRYPHHPPVVIMTGHGDKAVAVEALRGGAFEFLEKPFPPHVLKSSIEKALKEKQEDISSYRSIKALELNNSLTEKERVVAQLAAEGQSNDQIATKLGVSTETVKSHLKHIFKKLGIESRIALVNKFKSPPR